MAQKHTDQAEHSTCFFVCSSSLEPSYRSRRARFSILAYIEVISISLCCVAHNYGFRFLHNRFERGNLALMLCGEKTDFEFGLLLF